jgi:hypothetical protein
MTATDTPLLLATPTATTTAQLPQVVVIAATAAMIETASDQPDFLPTVTPTPPALILLPTPTPTRAPIDAPAVTVLDTLTPTLAPTISPSVPSPLTPTLPLTKPVISDNISDSTSDGIGASSFLTVSVPLPASYTAQGSFASQTVYADSTIAQQQGSFSILQVAATNAYGANQRYTLRTQRAVGALDEINVYQVDDYIAVHYSGGDWMLVRRDQGSNIVRAIQPITDLAVLFPRIIDQAEVIGQEEIAGIPSLRYRIDDPNGQEARLIQPLLALTGEIRSLKLEMWIAVPGGYAVAYNFQVELAGARVLDPNSNEVRADQAVTWTYQLTPSTSPEAIEWPHDAPTPTSFPLPGFSAGDFPMPANTELLTLVGGVPDLITPLTSTEVDSFYRVELFKLGWTVEGEKGLLRCSKAGTNFELMITQDATSAGTHISVLPGSSGH